MARKDINTAPDNQQQLIADKIGEIAEQSTDEAHTYRDEPEKHDKVSPSPSLYRDYDDIDIESLR